MHGQVLLCSPSIGPVHAATRAEEVTVTVSPGHPQPTGCCWHYSLEESLPKPSDKEVLGVYPLAGLAPIAFFPGDMLGGGSHTGV